MKKLDNHELKEEVVKMCEENNIKIHEAIQKVKEKYGVE